MFVPEVTKAESSTVFGRKQQSCVVRNWKCDRLALADRQERQSVVATTCTSFNWNAQLLGVTIIFKCRHQTAPHYRGGNEVRFDGDTWRWSSRAWGLSSLELETSEDHLEVSVLYAQTSASALWVVRLSAKLTEGSLWQWCLSDITHCCSSRDDWQSVRVPESW